MTHPSWFLRQLLIEECIRTAEQLMQLGKYLGAIFPESTLCCLWPPFVYKGNRLGNSVWRGVTVRVVQYAQELNKNALYMHRRGNTHTGKIFLTAEACQQRTCGKHKNLLAYIYLFLLEICGPPFTIVPRINRTRFFSFVFDAWMHGDWLSTGWRQE